MKKIFTLFAFTTLASAAFAQVTITSTDVPVPGTFNCIDFTSTAAPNPAISSGASWDYSPYTSATTFTNVYTPETITFFTAAGANVNTQAFKVLSGALGYNIYSEIAFTTTGVREVGINIPAQGYDLSTFTSSTADSIVIPAQQAILTTPKEIMHFPFTDGSIWSSVSRRVTNFTVSVAIASLSHTPAQHVYYVHRTDTIKGSGNLRVHTPSGPSMMYNVLVDKIAQYSIDSFYLSGAPAPTTLLTSFGMAQDQKSDTVYRYNFYRKGSFNYLMSYYYGGDASYSNVRGKYQNTDDLTAANAGIQSPGNNTYASVLFPNPTNGSTVNVLFSGKDIRAGHYAITDVTGRAVQSGSIASPQNNCTITLAGTIVNGNYTINIWDTENTNVVTEQFVVSR